jgi:hypothetical protein
MVEYACYIREGLPSEMLLTSDGVEVPLLSLVLSLLEGDEDFEKPRWVSLSSREREREYNRQQE